MRGTSYLIALLIALPALASVHAQVTDGIRISEVHPRPAVDGREFIELWNTGNDPVDLAGWTLADNTNGTNVFTFPAWEVAPGGRVVVWGGGNASALGPVWRANVWNNGGDSVTLRDDSGSLVDQMTYGTVDIPAPSEGESIHWDSGWTWGAPTPGQDVQGTDGSATATVEDLPPEVTWIDAPSDLQVGDNASVTFSIEDPNGDLITWQVDADGASLANGTGPGPHTVDATAPGSSGTWTWTVTAASTTLQTVATLELEVRNGTLRVVLPDTGIRLTGLVPGATDVAASASFQVVNTGTRDVVPYLDMSDFRNGEHVIPVAGNLDLQVRLPDGSTQVVGYAGPLQALPMVGSGDALDVTLVIRAVPSPLPAGDYRSSFTVVT